MIKRLASKTVFDGRIARVTVDDVRFPDGDQRLMEVVHHPGGSAVVALDEANRVALLRQYRYVLDEWVWELPAGKNDDQEPPLETACRELADEAGVTAARWEPLGRYVTSPGIFTEVVHLFLATDLELGEASPDPDELFELHWIDFEEVLRQADRGAIVDGKTLVGLWRARAAMRNGAD